MDRVQMLLVGLPLFLFFSDVIHLFSHPPPPPPHHRHPHHPHPPHHRHPPHHPIPPHHQQQPAKPAIENPSDAVFNTPEPLLGGGVGYGTTVELKFCASCSYRGNAVTMKKMLEASFPGIEVILENYPPALPKRLLSKVVPVVQMGVIAIITAGDQIFPRIGMAPPAWYFNLRANRFGAIASTWLFGNFVQSFLQSSGAFEVFCNGELVLYYGTNPELVGTHKP